MTSKANIKFRGHVISFQGYDIAMIDLNTTPSAAASFRQFLETADTYLLDPGAFQKKKWEIDESKM